MQALKARERRFAPLEDPPNTRTAQQEPSPHAEHILHLNDLEASLRRTSTHFSLQEVDLTAAFLFIHLGNRLVRVANESRPRATRVSFLRPSL
jgi:hypothetical protein